MNTRSRRVRVAGAGALAAATVGLAVPSPATAATGTVYVRGTVTCPAGQEFAGAWVQNATGASDFAGKKILPDTGGRRARIGRQLSGVGLPTTVSLNVGCGIRDGGQWRYVYNGVVAVRATRTGTVFINVVCTTTSCRPAARGAGSGNTTWNPASQTTASTLYGQEWCTYRASEFWKQMTGSYPGWGGDAGYWDDPDRAPAFGWQVGTQPEPDTLMVWQPGTMGPVGHVGYVADLRVASTGTQVKIYDRNADGRPFDGAIYDRPNAVHSGWMDVPKGAGFIRVPPRFTPHNR